MLSIDSINELDNTILYNIPQLNINLSEIYVSHIEKAHYYYEDILRPQNRQLCYFKSIREFSEALFKQSNILATLSVDFRKEFTAYMIYKRSIPLCGGILLNNNLDKVLLVRDFNSSSWTFPRGKKIPGESDITCAIREVRDETSFDITNYVDETDFITMEVQEKRVLKLYIIRNVPESFNFQPETIKEISGLMFYGFNEIPSNSFHIRPFLPQLFERLSHIKSTTTMMATNRT